MEDVRLDHRQGMGKYEFALSWTAGAFRYHVWMTREGEAGEHIYKNALKEEDRRHVRTVRLFTSNRVNQGRMRRALEKVGTWADAVERAEKEAVQRDERREAAERLEHVDRARSAFAVALAPWPDLDQTFRDLSDAEMLRIARELRVRL